MSMDNQFDNKLHSVLVAGGWSPERTVELHDMPQDYPIFPAANNVLREFGGLHIGSVGKGNQCATSDIFYDPTLASGLSSHTGLIASNGLRIFPLGEVHHGQAYLFIDEAGNIYLYYDELDFFANSHAEALRKLLFGEK